MQTRDASNDATIAARGLQAIRVALSMSLVDFSEVLGLSVSTISAVETGKRKLSQSSIDSCCSKLHITFDDLQIIAEGSEGLFEKKHIDFANQISGSILRILLEQHKVFKQIKQGNKVLPINN